MQNSSPSSVDRVGLPIDDKPVRRVGYLMLLVTFGLFGGWATLAPLNSAALAPGVVTVKSYRKTVQRASSKRWWTQRSTASAYEPRAGAAKCR